MQTQTNDLIWALTWADNCVNMIQKRVATRLLKQLWHQATTLTKTWRGQNRTERLRRKRTDIKKKVNRWSECKEKKIRNLRGPYAIYTWSMSSNESTLQVKTKGAIAWHTRLPLHSTISTQAELVRIHRLKLFSIQSHSVHVLNKQITITSQLEITQKDRMEEDKLVVTSQVLKGTESI